MHLAKSRNQIAIGDVAVVVTKGEDLQPRRRLQIREQRRQLRNGRFVGLHRRNVLVVGQRQLARLTNRLALSQNEVICLSIRDTREATNPPAPVRDVRPKAPLTLVVILVSTLQHPCGYRLMNTYGGPA